MALMIRPVVMAQPSLQDIGAGIVIVCVQQSYSPSVAVMTASPAAMLKGPTWNSVP
jgi:hypothetical protein